MKKLLVLALVCSTILFGQEIGNKTSQNDDMILSFMQLPLKQVIDTAFYYYSRCSYDTSLICYNLFINTVIKRGIDVEQQDNIIVAYSSIGLIYFTLTDYRNSYEYFIKALTLSEKYNNHRYIPEIYGNIGNIYYYFELYDMAKSYYLKSYELIDEDNKAVVAILNNLVCVEHEMGISDSAFYYLYKSLKISKKHDNAYLHATLNKLAVFYQEQKFYDSAYYYSKLALEEARRKNEIDAVAAYLSDISNLFIEINKIDSALHYIALSNTIAEEIKLKDILFQNYLTLSKIEELKGNTAKAFEYYKHYSTLRDSIYNAVNLGDINQLQRLYEVSKTNKKIEDLVIDQQIKDNTIHYQKIIHRNTMVALVALLIVLGVVLLQNNKLRKAYNVLVNKNVEIIELQEKVPDIIPEIIPENITPKSETPIHTSESENLNPELETPIPSSEPENLNPELETPIPSSEPKTINPELETSISSSEPETIKPEPETPTPTPEKVEKYPTCPLSAEEQNELLKKVLVVLDNTDLICKQTFSLDVLCDMLQSNHTYVSYVINRTLNKNFRSLLNSYRIKEAQRLFLTLDTDKFTVNSIGRNVGFKSYSGFYYAFKEITGVTPSYYFDSIQGGGSN